MHQMRSSVVVVIAMMLVIVGAHERDKRDAVTSSANVVSYREPRSRDFFFDRALIDETIGRRASPGVPMRASQTVGQPALRDISFRELSVYPSGLPISRHQSFKQNSLHALTTLRDETPSFRGATPKNEESRGERALFGGGSPFERQRLASKGIFEELASTYRSQAPFAKQSFTARAPFENLLHEQQSSRGEQASFWKQAALLDFPPISSSKLYRDDFYDKPIDSYGRGKDAQILSYEKLPAYMEYDNHALGMSSMPVVSSSERLLPLNEIPTMPPSAFNVARESPASSLSAVSSATGGGVHLPEAFKMELSRAPTLDSIATMSAGKCNTLIDSSSTTSVDAVTTVPSISVGTNQSSLVSHILTSLTTKPSSSHVTAPIERLVENTLRPIHFHATKYGAIVAPSFATPNELKSDLHTYPLPEMSKNSLKVNEHGLKYLAPEVPKNNMKTAPEDRSTLSYVLSEERRSEKDAFRNSLANHAPLPGVSKYGWPLQQFPRLEISSSFSPLSSNEKMNFILPSIPIAPASIVSWPMEIKHDASSLMLPVKFVTTTSNGAMSNNLPLGSILPLDHAAGIPHDPTPSTLNSISGSITGGISTGIPDDMTADMPLSIPTLKLGQSLHRAEQLRRTQEARKPWQTTGLQLQLGGFGGMNYKLHTSNPAARPMELGIASLIP